MKTFKTLSLTVKITALSLVAILVVVGGFSLVVANLLGDEFLRIGSDTIGTVIWIGFCVTVLLCLFIYLIVRTIVTTPIVHASDLLKIITKGDLSTPLFEADGDEISWLYNSFCVMQNKLTEVIAGIRNGANEVSTAAEQVSQGNADLSQRTQEQASSLEEIASSMEEMIGTVNQNSENAQQANQLAIAARDEAQHGDQIVAQAIIAMGDINSSSKQIADIISVIDEIAFQTTLLAWNAAGQEARVGKACQCRHRAWERLVAPRERDDAVEQVAAAHELDGVGDDLTAHERGPHAGRAHRDPIRDRDRIEFERRPAGLADTLADPVRQSAEVDVAGHRIGPGIRDPDERTLEVLVIQTHGTQHRPRRGPRGSFEQLSAPQQGELHRFLPCSEASVWARGPLGANRSVSNSSWRTPDNARQPLRLIGRRLPLPTYITIGPTWSLPLTRTRS